MHSLNIDISLPKEDIYKALVPQISSLVSNERAVTVMAQTAAALWEAFGFFWVGFYIVDDQELYLGPYIGQVACTRIKYGKGVCGSAWQRGEAIVVDDVDSFPGHIACSSLSKSEIVVPIYKDGKVIAVLDVDSDSYAMFDDIDKEHLTQLCNDISIWL